MARLSVNGSESIVSSGTGANNLSRGLDILFGGVEVFEVKARLTGLRKVLTIAGLILAAGCTAAAWSRSSGDERTAIELRNAVVVTGLAALFAIGAVRRTGAVWRFDHKRKTITRRHWLRGMSRSWNAKQVANVRLINAKSRLGGETAQLGLVDASGQLVAELGRWERTAVDMSQVEHVLGEIKKVMWWK